jgi:type IV pilus assembly protein PilM
VSNLFSSKKQRFIGIDLSPRSVKLVEMSTQGENRYLMAAAMMPLPPNAMDGMTVLDVDKVADAIKTCLRQSHFSTKDAVISVPDDATISRVIQLNENLTDNELEELVLLEADKYIPYPINEVYVDFDVIGKSAKPDLVDVLMVASRAINVDSRIDILKRANLSPYAVDVECYAMERVFPYITYSVPSETRQKRIVLIDLGSVKSRLFLFDNGTVVLSRDESYGGYRLVELISEECHLSLDESQSKILAGDLSQRELDIVKVFCDTMILHIKRSFQMIYSTTQFETIDALILSGGVTKTPFLLERLNQGIDVPTFIVDLTHTITGSNPSMTELIASNGLSLIVGMGLSMKEGMYG